LLGDIRFGLITVPVDRYIIGVARYNRPVPITPTTSTDEVAVSRATALFRGLADSTRLTILIELQHGERRVADLAEYLSSPQSTVSTHLACLRDCGLVKSRAVGRQSFYRLAVSELHEVLEAAEAVLAQTGDAVALCPRYGRDTSR